MTQADSQWAGTPPHLNAYLVESKGFHSKSNTNNTNDDANTIQIKFKLCDSMIGQGQKHNIQDGKQEDVPWSKQVAHTVLPQERSLTKMECKK